MKDLSNLVFLLLTPALLFRTMSKVQVQQLDFRPVAAYFLAVIVIFAGTLLVCGFNRRAAVLALSTTFGNTVMIGTPLVSLAWGEAGLVTLFTLYTVHTMVLLTSATLVLELAVMREERAAGSGGAAPCARHGASRPCAMRWRIRCRCPSSRPCCSRRPGWPFPPSSIGRCSCWAAAFAPMSLVLVGVTLASTSLWARIGAARWRSRP